MMKSQRDGSLHFSPSDLITFLQGEFTAWMERAHAERPDDPHFQGPILTIRKWP